jgi:predicted kinase
MVDNFRPEPRPERRPREIRACPDTGAIGRAPGAVHLRSDIERKRLLKVHEFDRLPGEAYRPETTARTYERLRDLASSALDAGHSVVIA